MSDVDLGTDFVGVSDLTADLSEVSGRRCLLEALLRRITTPRGGLFYDESYGTDVGAYVNTSTDPRVIEQAIETELLQDERVDNVEATVTVSAEPGELTSRTFTIVIAIERADGPFTFTVGVSALTGVQLLEGIGT